MIRKKNVLFVIAGLGNGGAEKQIIKLYQQLNYRDYNCYLLILNKKEKIFDKFAFLLNDERFLSLELDKNEKFLFFKILIKLTRIYRTYEISTVVSFLHIANVFTRLLKIRFPLIRLITSIRNDFYLQYPKKAKIEEYLLSPLSNYVLTNSQATKKYLENRIFYRNKLFFLSNIADINIPVIEKKKNVRPTVLSIGRLSVQKNYDFLLDVALRLKEVDFVILGEGVERERIEEKIKNNKLLNVILKGQVHNPFDFLSSADLFFLPSLSEGISNSMIEAMLSNTPVLASKEANTSDILINEYNGFVFDSFDVDIVSKKIREILNLEENLLENLKYNANQTILKEMNTDKVLKTLEGYL